MLCFLENIIDSDFAGLNLTNHLVAHCWIFDRSEFNWIASSTGLSTIIYRLVLSANNLIEELIISTISFIFFLIFGTPVAYLSPTYQRSRKFEVKGEHLYWNMECENSEASWET